MLLLGVLASPAINGAIASTFQSQGAVVSLAGGSGQFLNHHKGVLFTVVFAGTATWVLLEVVNAVIGLRVDREEETLGLDLSQHGERAYND